MSDPKSCFVIAPIGEADSETRRRSDQVLKHVIRPAVEHCGYSAVRADEIDKPGLITSQVIQRVVGDDLVVADLTERNPNVFYELALRHAIRKPLIQLIKKGEQIPFDVAGTRTIYFDHRDLDSVDAAKNEIINQIRSLERDAADVETPISVSLDLQLLRQSENPEDRSLADILDIVADMRGQLTKLSEQNQLLSEAGLDGLLQQLEELPDNIEKRLQPAPTYFRRRYSADPSAVLSMVDFLSDSSEDLIAIPIITSLMKDDLPWLHELGMEAYRATLASDTTRSHRALTQFLTATEVVLTRGWIVSKMKVPQRMLSLLEWLWSHVRERHSLIELPLERPVAGGESD